ncbi:hypothetical protein CNMCM5623_001943 [Aspergillus felis]|uniref:Uncharacterized protein n=1 Tax=Aspergillus felis TaxID=1287682 RepID=A0A8H6UYS2_9EURO|nr:hypothetical protein CNMCM5623_001943 [Aspergillus felis]
MLTKDLKGPLDDLKDLNEEQLENLQSWEERFLEKYLVVASLRGKCPAEHLPCLVSYRVGLLTGRYEAEYQ